ncbi:glycoside hydrolase [Neobacillus cucumis]|uniref:glycoside hydrolase n=1 Tax=Neobacillus cucumis TaxID=1740721 RepID=UPI002E1DA250|nr:glycoside hydrolase [Neobacillus cucumis]MED4229098.1 glycoside hydrolase [Neobacillus cucumis]
MSHNYKKLGKKISVCSSITVLTIGLLAPIIPKTFASETNVNNSITKIKLDPSYQQSPFDGWGTALAWFANITGGWPDNAKNQLADAIFGKDGLNFNIARYNIGGGDSPETIPYMRLGGAVPGYWNRPAEFGPPNGDATNWTEQKNWWNPNDPADWNWNADANQRWWLQAAKTRGANNLEAFSNSAPYFMTQSGYVSGNWNSWDDNLKPDQYQNFANYLTTVVEHFQKEYGIKFNTLSPVNEPNTGYWGAKGRQEGSNWSPASQAKIINEVKKQLDEKGLDTSVAAMEETNPQKFISDWDQYDSLTRKNIGELNVHTYGTGDRIGVRDIAKAEGTPLWMSEVDLSVDSQNFDDIKPGLALSERIQADMQELEPKAWVLWQAVEDEVNMDPQHENGNWGLMQVDFQSNDTNNVQIYKNKKYYAMGNYSKFIRPGDQVINSDNRDTLAAIDSKNQSVVVVYTNSSTEAKTVDFDLSGFGSVADNSKATPYVTSATDNLKEQQKIEISKNSLSTVVQPQSITTFVISGISGVNNDNSFFNFNDKYKISNMNSGKVLDVGKDGKSLVQKTYDRDKASQQWSIQKVTNGYSSKEYYKIVDTTSGNVLGLENGSLVEQKNDDNAIKQKWMLSTFGNQQYTLINAQSGTLLEVGGSSKQEDASVGTWTPNAGNNQVWQIAKAGVVGIEPSNIVVTKAKTAPEMPQEVTTIYGDGERVQKPVKWDPIAPKEYAKENIFTVNGTVAGTNIKAVAKVTVSKVESIEPIKLKTIPGKAPSMPQYVMTKLHIGTQGNVRVSWDPIDPKSYKNFGKFSVEGSVLGSHVKAIGNVQVTKTALQNIALNFPNSGQEYPKAIASFTGQYDKASNVNDGDISSIRWTNWDPNSWRPEDWLAIDFGHQDTVSQVDFHFYDDGGGTRPPASLHLEFWDGSQWKMIDGTQTDVNTKTEITLRFTPIPTSKVRAVMEAMPGTCIAMSEVMVWGKGDVTKAEPGLGDDATLDNIMIDGKPLKEFQSDKFSYNVKFEEHGRVIPSVTAETNDIFATYQVDQEKGDPTSTVIKVESEDKSQTNSYTVNFVK